MYKIIDKTMINFIDYDDGKTVVLLHGWGQDMDEMDYLGIRLDDKRKIIVDLPGFGESDEPNRALSLDDYADILRKLLIELNVDKPIIVGYDFGGKIAVKYASKYDVEKLVLLGTPCMKKDPSVAEIMYQKTKNTPIGSVIRKFARSKEYKEATPIMRKTLIKVGSEDILEDAKNVVAPTLLMWGKDDNVAPLEQAKELEEQMSNADLIELDGAHDAYLKNINQVSMILNEFFNINKTRKKIK